MRRRPADAGEEERKEGERGLTGGARLSAPLRKRKGEGVSSGPAGKLGWAAWAEGVWGVFVFFSFFFFSNFIFKSFFNSNSNQTFANLSEIFYRLFRDHTSNQETMQVN
jgi:hypothetical protein